MRISWMGHSCFLLETAQGVKIITDPYQSGGDAGAIKYSPVNLQANIVTVSHQHFDHNYTREFKDALIIEEEGETVLENVTVKGILSYHDKEKGRARGKNIIFIIRTDGLKIVHFGDLGTKDIDLALFKESDIVLIPIGGTFTIDAVEASELIKKISPKIAVPMHFKTPRLGFDIDGVEKFLKLNQNYRQQSCLEVNPGDIDSFKGIVVLDYQR